MTEEEESKEAIIAETLQYMEAVKKELNLRRQSLAKILEEIQKVRAKVAPTSAKLLTMGNAQKIRSTESYRKKMRTKLAALESKRGEVEEDVIRAERRFEDVQQELIELGYNFRI